MSINICILLGENADKEICNQITSQLKTYGRFMVLSSTINKTPTEGRMVFIPQVQFQRLVESMLRDNKPDLVTNGAPKPYQDISCWFFLYFVNIQ